MENNEKLTNKAISKYPYSNPIEESNIEGNFLFEKYFIDKGKTVFKRLITETDESFNLYEIKENKILKLEKTQKTFHYLYHIILVMNNYNIEIPNDIEIKEKIFDCESPLTGIVELQGNFSNINYINANKKLKIFLEKEFDLEKELYIKFDNGSSMYPIKIQYIRSSCIVYLKLYAIFNKIKIDKSQWLKFTEHIDTYLKEKIINIKKEFSYFNLKYNLEDTLPFSGNEELFKDIVKKFLEKDTAK